MSDDEDIIVWRNALVAAMQLMLPPNVGYVVLITRGHNVTMASNINIDDVRTVLQGWLDKGARTH